MEGKLVLYIEIKQLADKGLNVSQIASQLKISRPTVYHYLEMTFEEADRWAATLCTRQKKLDAYQDWILAWLQEFPHLSAAQIKDWLLERFPTLKVGDSTVRLYVKELREINQIPKQNPQRTYQAVPELPMGQQIQVDWGETKQSIPQGSKVKLHFMSFVLAHSRYKFMYWLNRPFQVVDAIQGHELAFEYFGGRTEELIYDQDRLIAVDENAGDLILTQAFQAYVTERGFQVRLCKGADPESKGKIEGVVKYIKYNFADSRIYTTIDNWNDRALEWLERTGNDKIHETTKKRPKEVYALEKHYLLPVSALQSFDCSTDLSISRNIRKDNTIVYRSNRYSLPLGSYQALPDNRVLLEVTEAEISILHPLSKEQITCHPIEWGRGKLVQKSSHRHDRSKKVKALKELVLNRPQLDDSHRRYIEKVLALYPRYQREQLQLMNQLLNETPELTLKAIKQCHQRQLMSANEVKQMVAHLQRQQAVSQSTVWTSASSSKTVQLDPVPTRSMTVYTQILGGDPA